VPYLSALEVCSRLGAIQIHVYLYLYLYPAEKNPGYAHDNQGAYNDIINTAITKVSVQRAHAWCSYVCM